jgi:hypothetical protein
MWRGGPRPPNYRRGYMGRDYHVTGEHEVEAKAAERAKKPTRLGTLVLKLLGYRGPTVRTEPADPSSAHHERRNDSP